MALDLQTPEAADRRRLGGAGLWLLLASSASFGLSGALAQSLLTTGWSPGAVVTARIGLAFLVLLGPGALSLRGRWRLLRTSWPLIVVYGVLAVAGCQLFYFLAVQRLSVAVALLIEYLSPIALVLLAWILSRRRPRALTLAGAGLSLAGLMLVLDVFTGFDVDALGVVFGLLAMVGSATYFLVSSRADDSMPPLALATGGLGVATFALLACGAAGLLPMHTASAPVELGGVRMHWLVPILAIALVSAALAYLIGIMGTARLGSTVASFVGLSEVLFAVLWAWLLVGERPGPLQLLGGLVILAGVAAVKYDELREARPAGGAIVDEHLPINGGSVPPPTS